MNSENNKETPSSTNEKCRYCASYLLPEAEVCTVCDRFRSWWRNYLRLDHLGILVSIVVIVFSYFNLKLSQDNLAETKQKRVEATAALQRVEKAEVIIDKLQKEASDALERVGRAEVTVSNVQDVLKEAQYTVADLKSNINFNILLLRASNDDRNAFNELLEISMKPGQFQILAAIIVYRILDDLATNEILSSSVQWSEYNIDPNKASIEEFQEKYKSVSLFAKPSYLRYIWSQERFTKISRLQMLYSIIQHTTSLRGLDAACRLMNQEARINKNIIWAHEYLLWWGKNKSKYELPIKQ
jgi:hypothetical protein